MKLIILAAVAVALTGIAAPAEAAGYGGGTGYRQYYGFPGSIFSFVLPYSGYGGYGYGGYAYQQYHAAPVLPARQVIRLLRRCDYRHVRHLTLHGGVYRAQARDRRGRRVNLIIDAYTGVIIAARYAY